MRPIPCALGRRPVPHRVGPAGGSLTPLGGAHRVDVYDRDRLGLFADTAGLLAAQGHIVRSAVVRTSTGSPQRVARRVTRRRGAAARDHRPRALRVASGDRAPRHAVAAPPPASVRSPVTGSRRQTRAMVIISASDSATVIEVRATDRPGLLHDIGITLSRASLSVRSAHIATYAGQALDTFYVTEFGGRPLPPARVAQAVSMIIDTCDAG